MIPILIADDHGVLRAGLRALLNSEPGLRVVGEAADGSEALALAAQLQPEIVLADINMPDPNGIQLAREIRKRYPSTRVLILTMHEDPALLREALQAGASGYVVKRAVETELVAAIRTVVQGDVYIDPELRYAFVSNGGQHVASSQPADLVLFAAEDTLLRLIASGKTNRQIAAELGRDVGAIEHDRDALQRKLGLRTRIDLMHYAREHGLSDA